MQTLTTSSTSVSLSFTGIAEYLLKAKANYPGNNTSLEGTSIITRGAVATGSISVLFIDPMIGKIQVEVSPIHGATSYKWFKNGTQVIGQLGSAATIPITKNLCDVGYSIEVQAVNACGTSLKTYKGVYVPPCDDFFMMSPNPATNEVTISSNSQISANESRTFSEIRIYDLLGNLKKIEKFDKVKYKKINISNFQNGNYYVEIIDGDFIEKKILLVQE